MCGFAGFCSYNGKHTDNSEKIIKDMTALIRHRGPDSEGAFCREEFSVGFSRLKIIDLKSGDQPMTDESGRYVLAFNGEIYNYPSIRKRLIKDYGILFKTSSDTEVLLHTLIHYGKNALSLLRGMYSFVFYDTEKRTLFAARDPFGIKPFYYGKFGDDLIFSSEIKAFYGHPSFKNEFNSDILPLYLQFQYVPTEESAFRGVKRLLAGHALSFDGEKLEVSKYFNQPKPNRDTYRPFSFWSAPVDTQKQERSLKKATELIKETLSDSVHTHLRSDVPVGTFLSGGVDSAYITALAKPKYAFTVGFDGSELDERSKARKNAEKLGVELIEKNISPSEFFRAVYPVQYHSDEPCANLSAVPLYLLAELASTRVKAVLSGEGADELFGGYELYNPGPYGKMYQRLPKKLRQNGKKLRFLGKKVLSFAERNSKDVESDFIGQAKIISPSDTYSILSDKYKQLRSFDEITSPYYKETATSTELQKKMYLDRHLWMPFDILNKADKMTMAHSVELRVPYLDIKVLAAAQTFSDRLLVRGKHGKYALRVSARKVLGADAAFRKKKGFPVPFRDWIKSGDYYSLLLTAFGSQTAEEFFDTDKLKGLLNAHATGAENNARIIYTVYAFIAWYDIYFGSKRPLFFTSNISDEKDSEREIQENKGGDYEKSKL